MKQFVTVLAAVSALAAFVPASAQVQPGPGDFRPVDAANTLVIDTNRGRVIVELYPEAAPATVAQVEALARRGFYDGLTFFRVIDGFMDQTGDPKNTGEGGSDLPNVKAEFRFRVAPGEYPMVVRAPAGTEGVFVGTLPVVTQPAAMAGLTADGKVYASALFCPGVAGFARAEDPDSGNSQFFLMRGAKMELDERYAAFGRVVAGEDVVRAIKAGEPVEAPQDRMTKVSVLADMPAGRRPDVQVMDTKSAYFQALVTQLKAARGDAFTPCDVDIPSTVR